MGSAAVFIFPRIAAVGIFCLKGAADLISFWNAVTRRKPENGCEDHTAYEIGTQPAIVCCTGCQNGDDLRSERHATCKKDNCDEHEKRIEHAPDVRNKSY